jgi:hypothetical protein
MTTTSVRFPDVTVYANDPGLSTFGLLTLVVDGLRSAGYAESKINQFYSDAAACRDHADVLRLVRATVRTL